MRQAGALDAPPEEGRGGDKGTDGKTELAPDAEKAHCRGLFVPGQIVHQPGAFRMEDRDAQSADHDGSDADAVGGGESGEGDAESYDEHGKRDQPGLRPAVGDTAEDRLKNGRDDVYREDDGGGGGEGEMMRRNKERKEDGMAPWLMSAEAWATVRSPIERFFITAPLRFKERKSLYNKGSSALCQAESARAGLAPLISS